MGSSYNPTTVTSGMVLCLDAANPKSYSGSGASWSDLSGNGNTATLANAPTFDQSGSLYLDGTGDYLTVASSSGFAFGTGDFTIECWFYRGSSSGDENIVVCGEAGLNGFGIAIYTNLVRFRMLTATLQIFGTTTVSSSTWHHVAVTRQSGLVRVFLNGVQEVSSNYSGSATATNLFVGSYTAAGSYYYTGYISNLRIVSGTAVYVSNFTVPTNPLAVITNTSFLACTSTGLADLSSAKLAITKYGNATGSTTSPFANSQAFGVKSFAFNGSTQYAEVAHTALLQPNTGKISTSVWFYAAAAGTESGSILINKENDYEISAGGGYITYAFMPNWAWVGNTAFNINTWYNVVVTYDGVTQKLYVNGVLVYIAAVAGTIGSYSNALRIGARGAPGAAGSLFNGRISAVQVYNRALSGADIVNNFNASCGRYSLPLASLVSPLSLSPRLWLDASDTSTLYQSNGGSLAVADGAVGYWLDKSGNGYHATQTTSAYKPLLRLNSFNNKSYLLFDGVDDCIDSTGPNISQPFTFFVVGQSTDTGTSVRQFYDGITGARSFFGKTGSDLMRFYSSAQITSTATTNKQMHYYSGIVNGASTVIYKDGSSFITGNPGANGLGGVRIGGQASPTAEPWKGPICELLFFAGAMSDINRCRIQDYLAAKWNL